MLGAIIVLDPVMGALDRRVLIELAARAGVALDNAVLYGSERRLALTLQRSLLPAEIPDVPGIELATRYLPGTGGRDVGGDFYIAHPLEDGRVLLVIGDVMGHGAQAAARMGQLRAVLAAYAYDGDPPDRVLAHLSVRAPTLLDLPMATVLAALYDPETRQLTFSLAGHLPPLIVPRDGEPYFADARPGPPLGAEAREYTRHVTTIPPHATLVFYTDGLIEERTLAIDVGMERLARRPRRRRPPAGRGGRPRAARAGPRAGRRGRHRPARHAGVEARSTHFAPSSNAATEDSPRNHTRRPRRTTTWTRPSR